MSEVSTAPIEGYVRGYYYQYEKAPCWKVYADMLSATHTLIAGTTGSGKSVVLRGILHALICNYSPSNAVYYLVDPKRTELKVYRDIDQFCAGYGTESSQAVRILKEVSNIMESRYKVLADTDEDTWTGRHIYVVIDELADLMISADGKRIKLLLQKITQLGRAAGIHIICATQCPNRKIIPAEITLNFTSRIALRCVSSVESRQIVQVAGAEKLPKHGKAIMLNEDGIQDISLPLVEKSDILLRKEYWKDHAPQEIWFDPKDTEEYIPS